MSNAENRPTAQFPFLRNAEWVKSLLAAPANAYSGTWQGALDFRVLSSRPGRLPKPAWAIQRSGRCLEVSHRVHSKVPAALFPGRVAHFRYGSREFSLGSGRQVGRNRRRYGSIRRICASVSRNKLGIAVRPSDANESAGTVLRKKISRS